MKLPKPQAMVGNDHLPVLCAREVCNNKPTVLYKSLGSVRFKYIKIMTLKTRAMTAENSALISKE